MKTCTKSYIGLRIWCKNIQLLGNLLLVKSRLLTNQQIIINRIEWNRKLTDNRKLVGCRPDVFYKITFLRSFIWEWLCRSHFLMKLPTIGLDIVQKVTPAQVFSYEISEISLKCSFCIFFMLIWKWWHHSSSWNIQSPKIILQESWVAYNIICKSFSVNFFLFRSTILDKML